MTSVLLQRSRRRARPAVIVILKRYPPLRRLYRLLAARVRGVRFRWHARGRCDPALIVFQSFIGRSYAGSPRALYEAMLGDPRFATTRFVWAFCDPAHADAFAALTDPRTSIVAKRSPEFYRAYGHARVWIGNSNLAPELVPRPDQHYLQTWHGTPFKRIGMDVVATTETAMSGKDEIDHRYRAEAARVGTFLSAGPFTTAAFASAFGMPAGGAASPLAETGNPRNDALVGASAAAVAAARARLGIPAGKRVVLYAPTWRDDQHSATSGYVYRPPLELDGLRESLGDDWLILARLHYLVTNSLDLTRHEGFVRDVSRVDEINEVMLAADVLVTDYSSVYFDFALLDRPMVFFMYDLERYRDALRGFYLPVDQVPGPIVTTQAELVAALRDPELGVRDAARRAEVNARMSPHDDGHACERVLDRIHARLIG